MLKRLKMFGIAAIAMLSMAATASAAPVIDFSTGIAGQGGNITQVGVNLIGTNIPIGAVTFAGGTPSNNGLVSLVTGTAVGSGPGGPFGDFDFNTQTGTFSIVGCITSLGIPCGTTLASGTIGSFVNLGTGILFQGGSYTVNALLAAAAGLPAAPYTIPTGSSFTVGFVNGPNGSMVTSTDLPLTPVPEPATMMLLGTGLLAAFRARRRQA